MIDGLVLGSSGHAPLAYYQYLQTLDTYSELRRSDCSRSGTSEYDPPFFLRAEKKL